MIEFLSQMLSQKFAEFAGIGKVILGDKVIKKVRYRLEVHRNYIDDKTLTSSGRVYMSKSFKGEIKSASVPADIKLTLVTREGYTLDCYVTDNDGTIKAAGDLYDSSGAIVVTT